MKHHYNDIISAALPSNPKWWDENGTPRFCEFNPDKVSNIYAVEVALCLIECQKCGTKFKVALSCSAFSPKLSLLSADHRLHYGDPPNTNCCPSGPTMNSEMLEVLEFHRSENHKWKREKSLENKINQ